MTCTEWNDDMSAAPQNGEPFLVGLQVFGSDTHPTRPKQFLRWEYAIAEIGYEGAPMVLCDCGWHSTDWTHWARISPPLTAIAEDA